MSYSTDVIKGIGVYINSEEALKLGIVESDYYDCDGDFKKSFPEESKKFLPLIYGFAPERNVGLVLILKEKSFQKDLEDFLKKLEINQNVDSNIIEHYTY